MIVVLVDTADTVDSTLEELAMFVTGTKESVVDKPFLVVNDNNVTQVNNGQIQEELIESTAIGQTDHMFLEKPEMSVTGTTETVVEKPLLVVNENDVAQVNNGEIQEELVESTATVKTDHISSICPVCGKSFPSYKYMVQL